ncbi:MAG TPA: protein kinase, partial [Acidobacteriota bacterium]|nr:protein kinase [Acidobacteriota bacterium]
ARHIYLQTERAIKVIHSQFVDDAEQVERFIREARILTEVQHPNLVQLFDFGMLEDQIFFMVMELLRGESVLQRIRKSGRIPFHDSLRIIREAAQALHCAHQKGIIHRDISPDNLLLVKEDSGNETTKVIDFGIAKPLVETSFLTATNVFLGKPEYCSPEQCGILEAGEVIDKRCDIYSLAVTFYHMLTGQLPFYATTPQGYLVKHAVEPPKPPSVYLADLGAPPELDKVILKALAKKREQRHSSLEEFLFDLDRMSLESRKSSSGRQSGIDKLAPGALFANRYFIETKLGQGGMGKVYKAIDKALDVPVAVKIMTRRIAEDERMLERLKREVILARKVAHSNVCRTYDIGEFEGSHYVSMEFIEGVTLSQMIRKEGPLTLERGADIVKQILEG